MMLNSDWRIGLAPRRSAPPGPLLSASASNVSYNVVSYCKVFWTEPDTVPKPNPQPGLRARARARRKEPDKFVKSQEKIKINVLHM